tara:strand:+ start:217 stop:1095 length:879 start_codon:yes stop_codon:yes gene_type:complete
MAKQSIGLGSSANDGSGDTIRAGGDKVNDNFTEVYNALGDGTTIAANTGTLVSNAYAIATYAANSDINTRLNLYAKVANVASLAALANTNSAIAKRAEVANVVSLAALANNNTRLALINTNLIQTNNAIRTLVSDRAQVSNAYSIVNSGKSYDTVPNYGAAVTYDISANGSQAYLVSNMGFGIGGAAGNNPQLTVRNETTIAFDLNGLNGGHPFHIRSGSSGTNYYSNTLIHVSKTGTISTGASALGKMEGVLYWQIPHTISSSANNSYTYVCSSHPSNMKGNIVIKDSGAI